MGGDKWKTMTPVVAICRNREISMISGLDVIGISEYITGRGFEWSTNGCYRIRFKLTSLEIENQQSCSSGTT